MRFSRHSALSVLAIGARPDNIELGCGGTLAKLRREGACISAIVLSNGGRGVQSRADRAEETRCAFAVIGIEQVHLYDFAEADLSGRRDEIATVIENHVREIVPYRVYTMFDRDWQRNYQAVYEASSIACSAVPQFLGYETPGCGQTFQPTVFERIGEVLSLKLRATRFHKSLNHKPSMQEDSIRAAAQFRGIQSGFMEPSEGFVPYRMAF